MKIWHGVAIATFLTTTVSYAFVSGAVQSIPQYGTSQALEPDTWASTWLIKNHIDPESEIAVAPPGATPTAEITYATAGGDYVRDNQSSAFQKLLSRVETADQSLVRMGEIIHGMESASWDSAQDETPRIVEEAYRTFQDRLGREYVPYACYEDFFDALYSSVQSNKSDQEISSALIAVLDDPGQTCVKGNTDTGVVEQPSGQVRSLEMAELLNAIAVGKKVVFVDTRETQEYQESHIPGAINIKLREIDEYPLSEISNADIVISYCLKDFRGYEVARKLALNGVENSFVMNPHGYVAWRTLGLPVTAQGQSEVDALKELQDCAADAPACLDKSEG